MKVLNCALCIAILALLTGCVVPYPHSSVRSFEFSARVLDARTHAPIQGAKVFLVGQPRTSCTTDATGHFRLKRTHNFHFGLAVGGEGADWPPGKFIDEVTISHPNYLTLERLHIMGFRGDILLTQKK